MIRRFTTLAPATATPVDDLVAGALPDRVQIAHERLAHQDDPALLEALSQRELAAARELAELVRDHERNEQRARIQAAADAAARVRHTAAELAEREAADLLRAAQAIGEQRHSSSPHAKVARLHQRKPRVLGLLTGVVAFSMLFSAVTVQQNIAPTGGMTNPMWWLSYGLEALISAVLVALMLSTGDTAEWGVIDRLWQVYTVEGVLLTASIALNTFPYVKAGAVSGIGIHAIAPIMIGVALVTHRLVAERYGRAIEQATAAVPDHEDLQARLTALTQVGGAGNQILPDILTEQPTTARSAREHPADVGERQPGMSADHAAHPGAGHPTAELGIAAYTADPAATMPERATTDPGSGAMRTLAGEPPPGGREPSAQGNASVADLDARLAAALRQTLAHKQISAQAMPAPIVAPGSSRPDAVEHERNTPASAAAEAEWVAPSGSAELLPEPIARGDWGPMSAQPNEGPAPTARETDSAPYTEQNAPIAPDMSARVREAGAGRYVVPAPYLAGEPEPAQMAGHPIVDHEPPAQEIDRAWLAAHDSAHVEKNQAPSTGDEHAARSAVSPVWLTNRTGVARGPVARHL
ncbi:hypothetical protein AB0C34_24895 [Nocardia sp. NPDC049220]|uniref:hypothetical protein n=1 Tax=Nocardia sp. NPDC049220 TaxID=3155273 RepID=UPI0033FAFA2A